MSASFIKFRSKFILKDNNEVPSSKKSYFTFENVTPTWYHNLPVNVLVKIFRHFDERELRTSIIPVCQQWKYAGLKPVLWKTFVIHGQHVPTQFICNKIRSFIYLETLHVDNIQDPATIMRQVCRCIPNIRKLSIRHCPPIPESSVRYIIKSCLQLEELDLSGTAFRGNVFYKELSGLCNLKKLNLSNNQHMSVKNLLTAVLNCRNLEDLRISTLLSIKEHLSDEDASLMVLNIGQKLVSLSLDCSSLSSSAFQTIFNCSKLERIGLYGATNLSGEFFVEIWKRFPNIKQLKIRQGHQICDKHVVTLFTNGKEVMKNLILLDFAGCWKISDRGVVAIAKCCKKLQSLGLKSCKGITTLEPICENCTELKALIVAYTSRLFFDTIFPLPASLDTLIIDDEKLYEESFQNMKADYNHVNIKICLSEYKKHREERALKRC